MLNFITGESLLNRWANSGTTVAARSLLVSLIIYTITICLKTVLDAAPGLKFDLWAARHLISETLPWLGAIFAGTYVALYSRFASQWNYLASLYNSMMAAAVQSPPTGRTSTEVLRLWQAGFIEDAEELHLASKPMFASLLAGLLANAEVRDAYALHTPGGLDRLLKLEARIERVNAESAGRWR